MSCRRPRHRNPPMQTILTVVGQISGLQELRGERAVGVLVRLLVARLSVLSVAASKRTFLGGARRDPPPSAVDEQRRQLRQTPKQHHSWTMQRNNTDTGRSGWTTPNVARYVLNVDISAGSP